MNRAVIESRLQRYEGDDGKREATLKAIFTDAGCNAPNLSEQVVEHSKNPNVICVLPGTSGKTIIVSAHYDKAELGSGVVDNWSGASLLPSLYQAVKIVPRQHSYIFVGFTDEEKGMVGSHYYALHMSELEVASTEAMVNLDTLGLTSAEVWVSHSDKRLTAALVFMARQMKLPVSGMNVEQVGTTDAEQFAARNIPRITIHSLTQETWNAGILHSPKDKISAIHLDDYYQTYQLLATYISFLDDLSSVPQVNDIH